MARESYIVHNELTGENYLDDNSKGRNRRFYSHIDELLDALPNSLIGFKPTRLNNWRFFLCSQTSANL